MPGKITISLSGWGELEQALKEIGPRAARKVGGKAMKEAADIIVEQAKAYVPVDTGDLEEGIISISIRSDVLKEIKRQIGFKTGVSWRAHFIEYGTVKMRPQPFMRPALDARAEASIAIMGEVMWEGIEDEAKKAPKGTK